ncbi:type II toxin-antitoxin system HicB family antitoxin [bacterium]|nr:type II toxin-antitoxin system HicB family antitoxin [bacterium]
MKKNFDIKLNVSVLKEGDKYIAYSPALDISTCGKNIKEAKKRFSELVEIFFEETEKNGTTMEVLEGLGWKRDDGSLKSPVVFQEDKDFKILIDV